MENLVDTRMRGGNRPHGSKGKKRLRTVLRKEKRSKGPAARPSSSTKSNGTTKPLPRGKKATPETKAVKSGGRAGSKNASSEPGPGSRFMDLLREQRLVSDGGADPEFALAPGSALPAPVDDPEVRYYEEKLGLKPGDSHAREKLRDEFEEDGLGDLFDFVSKFDNYSASAKPLMSAADIARMDEEDRRELEAEARAEAEAVDLDEDSEDDDENDGGSRARARAVPEGRQYTVPLADSGSDSDSDAAGYGLEGGEGDGDSDADADMARFAQRGSAPEGDSDDGEEDGGEGEQEDDEEDADEDDEDEQPRKRQKVSASRRVPAAAEAEPEAQQQQREPAPAPAPVATVAAEKKKFDLYGRSAPAPTSKLFTAAYVPPHLRGQDAGVAGAAGSGSAGLSAEASKKRAVLGRQVRGLINRLTQANIEPIANEFRSLLRQNSRRDMTELLCDAVLSACGNNGVVLGSITVSCSALVTALHIQAGHDIGAFLLERCVLSFDACWKRGQVKAAGNILLFIIHLYNFEIIHCKLLYDIIRQLCAAFTEPNVELLLLLIQNCGFELRRDDPTALKEIVLLAQAQARAMGINITGPLANAGAGVKDASGAQTQAEGEAKVASAMRIRVMLELIADVKSNKRRLGADASASVGELLLPLKNFIKSLTKIKGRLSESHQLNLSWDDLINAATKGRWWVVGATWKGNMDGKPRQPEAGEGKGNNPNSDSGSGASDESEGADLLTLARSQRMNTDIRKSIFCVIMGAQDYMDAFEKILKLNLKSRQEGEVMRVLLHCCGQETVYNPYYAHVSHKLCAYERVFRFSLQLALWDLFKVASQAGQASDECSPRKAVNAAKLLAHLVCEESMSLAVLKPVEFQTLQPRMLLFLHTLFTQLLSKPDPVVKLVFKRIAPTDKDELEGLRGGVLFYFLRHFLPMISGSGSGKGSLVTAEQAATLAGRIKLAKHAMGDTTGRVGFKNKDREGRGRGKRGGSASDEEAGGEVQRDFDEDWGVTTSDAPKNKARAGGKGKTRR